MKLAVVTDSTVNIEKEYLDRENLFILPIPVIVDGQMYYEGKDIKNSEYYQLLNDSKEFPTTSQPSLGEVAELYNSIIEKGYDTIISIHLSSGISGFVNNIANVEMNDSKVTIIPFDSLMTSAPMGKFISTALDMNSQGESLESIVKQIEYLRNNMGGYILVEDLNNLVRGGRLTNGAAIIGSLLKIKPVLRFENGNIVLFEKIRTHKKAIKRVTQILKDEKKFHHQELEFAIIHANRAESALDLQKALQKTLEEENIPIYEFGPVVGTHVGEGAIGFTWIVK